MSEVLHRIRIFVYEVSEKVPSYLLLRPAQGVEACWGPIQGSIGFDEQLESAIKRELRTDAGISSPLDVIDLGMPSRWLVGDEQVVEWNFGVQTARVRESLRLDDRWSDYRWADFSKAYPSLELEFDRAAIMRLHTLLSAA